MSFLTASLPGLYFGFGTFTFFPSIVFVINFLPVAFVAGLVVTLFIVPVIGLKPLPKAAVCCPPLTKFV
jgi:hypothetical protein